MDLSLFANGFRRRLRGCLLNFYPNSSRKHNIFWLKELVSTLGIAPSRKHSKGTQSLAAGDALTTAAPGIFIARIERNPVTR